MSGSWWWGSSAPVTEFDRVLEACTSSNLPSSAPPPITDSLALSDLIRSSAVPASHAVKSLRKRLTHSNPNVQLLATTVIDICIKNGGDAFLKEIGARDFSEECAQILTNPSSNREVREKLKKEFQNWALAFEAVSFLSHSELVHNYKRLSSLGIEFPPRDPSATAAMVDSMSAPEWRDSDVCERCRTPFSFTNRKHHCRNCGGVFDAQCSSKRRALAHFGVTEPVRICDGCDRTLSAGNASASKTGHVVGRRNSFSGENQSSSPSKLSMPGSHHRSATFHAGAAGRSTHRYTHSTPNQLQLSNREEDDLERAIALSLQELNPPQRAPFISRSLPEHTPAPTFAQGPSKPPEMSTTEGDDDPALAAAIAASLRDVENSSAHQPSAPFPASPSEGSRRLPPKPPLPSYELTSEQTNVLYNFSTDVDSALQAGSLNPSNPSLRQSHAQAEAIRPLMMRGIENADRKMQLLREMNDKLSGAVRTYDRLLSEQIMYRTQSSMSSGTVDHSRSAYAPQPSYNPSQIAPYHLQPNFTPSMQPPSNNPTLTNREVPNGPHQSYLHAGYQPHASEARQMHPNVPSSEGDSGYNFNSPYHPQASLGNDLSAPHQAYPNGPTSTSPVDMRPSPLPHGSLAPVEHTPYNPATAQFSHNPQSFATNSEPAKLNPESSTSSYHVTNESSWINQPAISHYDPQHQELRSVVPGSTYLSEPGSQPISTSPSMTHGEPSGMLPVSVERPRDSQNPWSIPPDFRPEVSTYPVEEVHASIPITTPSFPSVPNTEPRWTHEWEMHGDMQPNRQEEVGPLIEL
ncbi:uncharacterized protein MELLADRAFT_118517 [Melampsora larici-populina 98AG31]|uniref:Vacuolar protein sorting-associated protein 27 n=1 Tax=Melampsora larici-populina (strain 98AG31 / pathotype 3-4-7) TaxID=747676 RepID=F4S9Y6_MELLP|nr:uncharacterized protein MELLADRAFT_118517 [Melampsora larici-populina 98AG31]EGF98547.1 hypothetical protein MELLADRAFT_118517 [Melampsora larici-populina 98AG31]